MARLWELSLKSLCFSITVEACGSVAGVPEEMSRLSKEVEELRGGLSQLLARTMQMSSAGSTRAKTVSYPPSSALVLCSEHLQMVALSAGAAGTRAEGG